MKKVKKLVRDKIPLIISKSKVKFSTRILDDEEYYFELKSKLIEEVNEYLESESVEELVDIQEVLFALLKFKNITIDDFFSLVFDKRKKRGAFVEKIYLDEIET